MESLFPSAPGAAGFGPGGTTLVSFNAGKCLLEEPKENGKVTVSPDLCKGTCSLTRSNDGAVKFKWVDRNSGVAPEGYELFLFPGVTFKRVNTGKDTDRVYSLVLDAGARDRAMLFWMQDKSEENDTANCTKINDYANNPQAAAAAAAEANSGAANAVPGASAALGGGDPSDPLSAFLAQLAMAPGAGGAPNNTTPAAPSAGGLTSEAFRNIMAGAGTGTGAPATTPGAGAPAQGQGQGQPPLELQDIVQADAVLASNLLDDDATVASLIGQLPEGQQTREGLETALRSPQLREAMRSLSRALQGEDYNTIMANFGLSPQAGMAALMRGEAVQAFVDAVHAANPPNANAGESKTDEGKMDEGAE